MTELIRDWMTPNPITINGDNTLSVAYNLMRINHVRHLPVVNDDDRLIGLLTWGDVREARPKASSSKEQNAGWEEHFLAAIRDVREFMTPIPQTASIYMPVAEAARLMMEQKIGCLPVVDDGKIFGIVTAVDLFRFIIETQPVEIQPVEPQPTEIQSIETQPADGAKSMATAIPENSWLNDSGQGNNKVYPLAVVPHHETVNA